jgi:uncharacterized phage protein (TIGR02218 family)
VKPCTPELLTLLATRQFFAVDLYTFNLIDGGVLRYGAGDIDVSLNGIVYTASGFTGPYFDRKDAKAKAHQKAGVQTDTLVFDVMPGTSMVFGQPFLQFAHEGGFDGATLKLDRAFMKTYGDTSAGAINIFSGRVGDVATGRSVCSFTVNSWLEILNLDWPRNLWMPGCINSLGDSTCDVSLGSYAVSLTVSGGSRYVIGASVPGVATYFDLGKISFTSGVLNGLSRSIRSSTSSSLTLLAPFPSTPTVGDSFVLYPGCDKTLGVNGCSKFLNTARYRGFPFIPSPSTAL